VKSGGSYTFFASDGGLHQRQMWQGRWVVVRFSIAGGVEIDYNGALQRYIMVISNDTASPLLNPSMRWSGLHRSASVTSAIPRLPPILPQSASGHGSLRRLTLACQ
jgi:hypothetical protein